jgi:RNA polymerase sigma factor (sigma-70 family)
VATEPPSPAEPETLLPSAERPDAPAWRDLVQRYGPRLRVRLGRTLRRAGWQARPDRVDDLLQEVFCRLLAAGRRRPDAFRGTSAQQLDAYLGRIAERVAVDELRSVYALKRDSRRLGREGLSSHRSIERAVDPAGTPLDRLLLRERRRLFVARCGRLAGPRSRRHAAHVARLALIEGWSSREIVRALGGRLAASSVDSLVHRLRRRLAAAEGLHVPPRPRPPRRSVRRRRACGSA